jgi:hypothetical protein
LKWDGLLDAVRDGRRRAQIAASVVVRAILAMCLCRLGSLNALGQTAGGRLWRRWLGQGLPSPDTIGRVATVADLDSVRALGRHVYDRLKRNKALDPPPHGLIAAVLDGHELHASYKQHCPGCLQRRVKTAKGDKIQYYHRLVAVSLITRDLRFMLDAEPIMAGEDEVGAALRLLDRVVKEYPRAFDLVQGDALYADSRFFNWAVDHGKFAMAVLKNNCPELLKEAMQLSEMTESTSARDGAVHRQCWDMEGFKTWTAVKQPVRIVRSRESRSSRSQLDKQVHEAVSDWLWVTTLPKLQAPAGAVVQLGHGRWGIENEGFNELVNQYHADHVYRHDPTAIIVFWLLTQLCLNVFVAFFRRNLKPAARKAKSMLQVSREMMAELLAPLARGPT